MARIVVHNPTSTVGVSRPGVVEGVVVTTGPQGPPGPAGSSGGNFYFSQPVPASTWVIKHNMNRKPSVSLILSENPSEAVYTDVTYPDNDTIVVVWPSPESGWAYI